MPERPTAEPVSEQKELRYDAQRRPVIIGVYAGLAQRVTHREVLRILLCIGGSETMHLQIWHDTAGRRAPR